MSIMPHPATPIYNSLVSALKHDTRPLAINVYNLSQIRHYETIWREHLQMLATQYNRGVAYKEIGDGRVCRNPGTVIIWDDANFMQHSRDYIKYFNRAEINAYNTMIINKAGIHMGPVASR